MARKARKTPETPSSAVKEVIMDMIAGLWDKHSTEIEAFREEAEDKKVKVNFGILIDYSKSDPSIKTGIRFSQAVTDEASATIDDPSQGTFDMTIGKRNSEPKSEEAETAD